MQDDRNDARPWECVLIGEETLLTECGKILLQRGHHIVAVVSERQSILQWCGTQNIPAFADIQNLDGSQVGTFDYLFSIANLKILPEPILALPLRGAINFHDGPLPHYPGLNAPVRALINGEAQHGINWHRMTAEVDRGAILASRAFAVDTGETTFSLNTKCFAAAIDGFVEMIDGLAEGTLVEIDQADAPPKNASDRTACAGMIPWDANARQVENFVRALDFGAHANPVAVPTLLVDGRILTAKTARAVEEPRQTTPGTILRVDDDALIVATGDGAVRLEGFATPRGVPLAPHHLAAMFGLTVGARFDWPNTDRRAALSKVAASFAVHEPWWRKRLLALDPLPMDCFERPSAPDVGVDHLDHRSEEGIATEFLLASIVAYVARIHDRTSFDIGFGDTALHAKTKMVAPWFAQTLPLRVEVDFGAGLQALQATLAASIAERHQRKGYRADLPARLGEELAAERDLSLPLSIAMVEHPTSCTLPDGCRLLIAIGADGTSRWLFDRTYIDNQLVLEMQRAVADICRADGLRPIGELPLASMDASLSGERIDWRKDATIYQLFQEQAARTPMALAVTCRGESLTYGALDERSNRVARRLQHMGVRPDDIIGLYCDRSVDMVVALLAIWKAGGAYVPLDPAYPAARIDQMVEDAKLRAIVTLSHLVPTLAKDAPILSMDGDWAAIAAEEATPLPLASGPENLAYVIFTSGSTGRPKGVMVEHRNVVNFFAGMDRHVTAEGKWLAVTSLSFDISVLELAWTLTRGMQVVLATGQELKPVAAPKRPVDFSLFYFSSDEATQGQDKYRLLLEGARFADRNGFAAVWTPERHFHAFGGIYPNPAVAGAAIAAITDRVQIRGGSVVLPLHHPARVAEEWAVVDNLSGGRVGIAFASGWQPNDFALRPAAYADRNTGLVHDIETIRALWRGESRSFEGPVGPVEVQTLPRPVQAELPFWITSAGNAETFAAAGRAGASILTHLLGQSVEELTEKIRAYREARREAGHTGEGQVTLMLHSFVGPDAEAIRAIVREPLIAYLRTATSLVKQYAWSFPAFKRRPGMADTVSNVDFDSLSPEETEMLLEHAFERYFESSGLFGTPKQCLAMVDRLRTIGVDEIANLIDFGVDSETVLAHLPYLDELRRLTVEVEEKPAESIAMLMERHGITHLQCTPSMMRMLLAEPGITPHVAGLRHLMIGGEAFPPDLADDLAHLVRGKVTNMYGPTETTIWSAIHPVATGGAVPLGRPLVNQDIHIMDSRQQAMPPGVPGEIVIGGAGVVRGYLYRPELTGERFVTDPGDPAARLYRTGDLGRRRRDGTLEFLGRLDHQVKIRGYRIELGEIEALLHDMHGVREAVVNAILTEDGEQILVAYAAPLDTDHDFAGVREALRAKLPEFMVPTHYVGMARLPQTPNGKIDRNALPRPERVAPVSQENFVAPDDGMESRIAVIWRDILKLETIGSLDNFFDAGGHSLLAVQLHRRLTGELGCSMALTDIFRFPTIRTLAAHLSGGVANDQAARDGFARADGRKAALARRAMARTSMERSQA
ncbi:hypothetical protein DM806_09175 [Sphingobium lactosutens]|uniref:MupA/Atu3671 family FMN-dependent luciferase-like monooxygenase n=1 Tax=Sphingobium lactosutens TaxID=522773 RepID=UPI0015B99DB6|nr:MupA/Atu3671 family FMN-dependent luciferase-like monooxygenase [Sphingobium lactosutens]NWK95845.1 hypothetical protein [Sphingobium lactosutens]